MFRFFSRVVVVSVFALSLNLALATPAQARQSEQRRDTAGTDVMERMVNWLSEHLGQRMQPVPVAKKVNPFDGRATANSGPCIDPWGNPKPCQ